MKKYLMIVLCFCISFSTAIAQESMTIEDSDGEMVSMEDFERYVNSALEMDYRNTTIEALELTEEETIAFDPIFSSYMDKKKNLMQKRARMLKDFQEEMDPDDSAKNLKEDKADFIEDYWELTIDEMELRKDYFDKLEDKIALNKAIQFFVWEQMAESRMNQEMMVQLVPVLIRSNEMPDFMKYDYSIGSKGSSKDRSDRAMKSVKEFDKWVSKKNSGKVDLSHEYTYNGIKHLLNAVQSVSYTDNWNKNSVQSEKSRIMNMAAKLKENRYSDEHADLALKAFTAISDLMNGMEGPTNKMMINLDKSAKAIDPDVLLTKQAQKVYTFFEEANRKLQSMKTM